MTRPDLTYCAGCDSAWPEERLGGRDGLQRVGRDWLCPDCMRKEEEERERRGDEADLMEGTCLQQ